MEDFFVRISNALTSIDLSGSNLRCVHSFAYGARPRDIGTASLGAGNYKRQSPIMSLYGPCLIYM